MPPKFNETDNNIRKLAILNAAKWCFLNFGFAKTSFDDIAKRAEVSRTLLYRYFKDKDAIYSAVFAHWLLSRHAAAVAALQMNATPYERLLAICKIMVSEPWSDMVNAPMASEFYEVCDKINPKVSLQHRNLVLQSVAEILGDGDSATVFVLALDGMLADEPNVEILERRIQTLCQKFTGN